MREVEQFQYISDPIVRQARLDAYTYSIPRYVYEQWRLKYHDAKSRKISFSFTLLRWHLWWKGALASKGPDAKRGNRKGQYMMCRINDEGGYDEGNVYAGTAVDNYADRSPSSLRNAAEAMRQWHANNPSHLLGKVGDDHPKSRAVLTEDGTRYGSIALASKANNITRQAGFYRIKSNRWTYDD